MTSWSFEAGTHIERESVVLDGVLHLCNLLIQLLFCAALQASATSLVICRTARQEGVTTESVSTDVLCMGVGLTGWTSFPLRSPPGQRGQLCSLRETTRTAATTAGSNVTAVRAGSVPAVDDNFSVEGGW
jgi:hypothetical protein